MKNRPFLWVGGLFLLMILLGLGILLFMPLVEVRHVPAPLTAEAIALLDDQYAFRILASRKYETDTPIIEQAEKMPEDQNRLLDADGKPIAVWVDVDAKERNAIENDSNTIMREIAGRMQVLALIGEEDVSGEFLIQHTKFSRTTHSGGPAIAFQFDGLRFARLTGINLPDPADPTKQRRLAIILDGEVKGAPTIMAGITDRGVISFGQRAIAAEQKALEKQIDDLVKRLRVLKKII